MHTSLPSAKEKQIRSRGKVSLILFLLLGLILTLYIFSDNVINFYQNYFVNNNKQVLTYLDTINQFKKDSTEIVEDAQERYYRMYLNVDDYYRQLKDSTDELQKIINKTNALQTPKDFSHQKDTFIKVLNQQKLLLSEFQNANTMTISEQFTKKQNDIKYAQIKESQALMKAFESAGIDYKEQADGSIRYWYKIYSGKSFK